MYQYELRMKDAGLFSVLCNPHPYRQMEFKITFQNFEQLITHMPLFSCSDVANRIHVLVKFELLWVESCDDLYLFLGYVKYKMYTEFWV